MPAPADYKNKFLKKPPKRLAVIDQNSCSGCANSPACVAFCETVTVKDDSGAAKGKVKALALEGVHNCCNACNKAIVAAVGKVDGVTIKMNGDNHSGSRRYGGLDCRRIEGVRVRADVHQHR